MSRPDHDSECALYVRISEDPRDLQRGVTRQLEDCHAEAKRRGLNITDVFQDNDITASKKDNRPGYASLVAAVGRGEVRHVVVYMQSRIWRNRRERAEGFELFQAKGVGLVCVKGLDIDFSDAQGRMIGGIMGEVDTAESEVKGERIAREARQRAEEGRANGRVAFGWRREYLFDQGGHRIGWDDVEHPEQAPIVREIVDRLLAGEGQYSITQDLTERGIPSPRNGGRWYQSVTHRIAIRPANVGIRTVGGKAFSKAAWPALVDQDKHTRVVALLSDPARRKTRKHAGRRAHMLTFGVGECGPCGSVLRVNVRADGPLYTCNHHGCVGRREDYVDALINAAVVDKLSRPDARALFLVDDTGARAAADAADAIRARLAEAADLFEMEEITGAQLSRITAGLRPKLADAEKRARPRQINIDPALLDALANTEQAASTWAGMLVEEKHNFLDGVGMRVRILPVTRRGPGFDPDSVDVDWPTAGSAHARA
jgi:DNA invertase Pin-like site-specific DNA recombinase